MLFSGRKRHPDSTKRINRENTYDCLNDNIFLSVDETALSVREAAVNEKTWGLNSARGPTQPLTHDWRSRQNVRLPTAPPPSVLAIHAHDYAAAETDIVLEAYPSAFDLADSRFPPELPDQFRALCQARRPQRMSL